MYSIRIAVYIISIYCTSVQFVKNYLEVLIIEGSVGPILFSSEIKLLLLVNNRREASHSSNCK
jgi:hypothetical protein